MSEYIPFECIHGVKDGFECISCQNIAKNLFGHDITHNRHLFCKEHLNKDTLEKIKIYEANKSIKKYSLTTIHNKDTYPYGWDVHEIRLLDKNGSQILREISVKSLADAKLDFAKEYLKIKDVVEHELKDELKQLEKENQ